MLDFVIEREIFLQPIFLYRNLSYMRQRMSRSHKSRENFKVDSILGKKLQEQNVQKGILGSGRGYINISFLGFYDKRRTWNQKQIFH